LIIPIEVKSGKEGTLKSLHSYMDLAPHDMAIQFYAGALNITNAITKTESNIKYSTSHIFWVLKLRNILLGLSKQKKLVPEMRTGF